MEKILDIISAKMAAAFAEAGYDASFGRVTVSNRPDLCEYQCNGALAAAKQYKCAPIMIAKAVVEKLDANDYSMVEAVMPGFINLKLSGSFLANYLNEMRTAEAFAEKAHNATFELQSGRRGYRAIWQHIMKLSVADMTKIYNNLDVHFESWLGESDADPYIPAMIENFKAKGLAVESEGALVIPVAQEGDKKEVPPCILVKSDGSAIYATTDLATMVQRMKDFAPDKMLYITDKRQALHFEQVFRAAKKGGIVPADFPLEHLGFGTMNGKDGKPFKTRDGGVMRLEQLIADMTEFVRAKVVENKIVGENEVDATTAKIALAALKYGDLSNQPTKDYVFDMDRFAAFEGNTGPYILYTIVRIKSILARYGAWENLPIQNAANQYAKDLMLAITKLGPAMESALKSSAPNLVCAYIYELAGCVNKFYHETPILKEEDAQVKAGHIALIALAKNILEQCITILGITAPEKM